ncbi:MAG TPA: PilZ domain-containing protein [Patescibacteria group bacterium]|nr:PilZ domain-containing protein [Patescibacteria group bacterium]
MRPPVLIVARQSGTLLGLAQAVLKFGYQIVTAYPEPGELERAERVGPALVIVRPPAEPEARRKCLDLVKKRFRDRGMPVLACVADEKEAVEVRAVLGQVPILAGSPLRLNDLYLRIHEMFDLASRRELRIRTELAVAYREPGIYTGDQYNYDTIRSLSLGGCFIECQAPFQVGMKIELVFCVGSGSRSLKVGGKVIRVGPGDQGAGNGMGVQFDSLPEAERGVLESFLMSQLGTLDLPASL